MDLLEFPEVSGDRYALVCDPRPESLWKHEWVEEYKTLAEAQEREKFLEKYDSVKTKIVFLAEDEDYLFE